MNTSKNILITGASRGIGQAIARQAAQQGWSIGLNYNQSQSEALSLAEELRQMGVKVVCLQADVSQQSDVQRMFREFEEAVGPLHALINNAGILASFLITEVDETKLNRLYGANVFSAYYCAREAVLRMSTAQGGSGGAIVNMSSVASRLGGLSGGSAYAGSKGALDSFNLALAKEVGAQGVRVNAIRPGLIATDIHNVHGGIDQMKIMAKTAVPMGRSGTAEEVAKVAMWLAGPDASYVHGSIVDVAGGR
ncbi:SDR family oxidoreductase [Limnohabitans sp. Rim8]|jgi:NAD(P)-dependent dehydrogenase (short-subunit alcohol dehydrogenase family)|uniref:SDR family oxidoreductase n=1 Tax=Limnohabitans sp. Rim8 TaxID=1100718 RepID=UPI0025EAF19C|nr:SDR family oxidoreductase [Limnohabitans sp. Rim8]